MDEALSKIDRLKVGMTTQEQEMQAAASAQMRDTRLYMDDVKVPSDEEFYEELAKAKKNGLSEKDADSLAETYEKADTDLSQENSALVKTAMQRDLEKSNADFEDAKGTQRPERVYDDTALKGESLYRAGIEQEVNDSVQKDGNMFTKDAKDLENADKNAHFNDLFEKYHDSTRKALDIAQHKDDRLYDGAKQMGLDIPRDDAISKLSNGMNQLGKVAMQTGKEQVVNIGGNSLHVTPEIGQDGKKTFSVTLKDKDGKVLASANGKESSGKEFMEKLKQLAKKVIEKAIETIPGAREAMKIAKVVKMIIDAIKKKVQEQQQMQEAAIR